MQLILPYLYYLTQMASVEPITEILTFPILRRSESTELYFRGGCIQCLFLFTLLISPPLYPLSDKIDAVIIVGIVWTWLIETL